MKGVVFTEFLEMVEQHFSPALSEQIVEAADLASDGVYTAVGTYDHRELLQLVQHLSQATTVPVAALVRTYGKHLFQRFVAAYPQFFAGVESPFDLLESIERHIHVEVRKLYPEAELPTFHCDTSDPARFVMTYQSARPFADLAEGLIQGCIEHYAEDIVLDRQDLDQADATRVCFVLTKQGL